MAIPAFLSSSYNGAPQFVQLTALTDVETGGVGIITSSRTLLVTNLGWTEPSANLFKSPVQADGGFMDILLTRISATNLEMRLRDQAGNTICTRRIQIAGGGTDVRIFAGKAHYVVTSMQATHEILQAYILETSPAAPADVPIRVCGNGYRTAADAVDGQGSIAGWLFAWDNGVAGVQARLFQRDRMVSGNFVSTTCADGSGRQWWHDCEVAITLGAGIYYFAGRLPQMLQGNSTVAFGLDKTLPIDDATTGVFQCLGLTTTGSSRFFVRKS